MTEGKFLVAVGLDDSESSWKAVKEAVRQARAHSGELHIVSIQESAEATYSASEALAEEKTSHAKLERAQLKARMYAESEKVTVTNAITKGSPVTGLVDYVKSHGIHLLVVGDTGHSSIWGALLGTSAEKIVRHAPCSVMIVRQNPFD